MWPTTLVLLSTLAASIVSGSSQRPPPLHPRALSHPEEINVQVVARGTSSLSTRSGGEGGASKRRRRAAESHEADRLEWDDRFFLSFVADDQPIVLSLRPSTTLLHPSGIKSVHTHTDLNGVKTTETRWVERDEVRAYEGWVLGDDIDVAKWAREEIAGVRRGNEDGKGWARIVMMEDSTSEDGQPTFQGSFQKDNELYTIHATPSYLRTREPLDPDPPLIKRSGSSSLYEYPSMVIVKERAVLSPTEHIELLRKRGSPIPASLDLSAAEEVHSSCSHDRLDFNSDPDHVVYRTAREQSYFAELENSTPWLSNVWGMPSKVAPEPSLVNSGVRTLEKRQGDISGGGNASSNFINSIGSNQGCPKSAMVLFVGVAADCTYVDHYTTADLARTQILTDFNSASSLYLSSFNVSLGIVELNVQSGACPTTSAAVDPSNQWNVGCQEGGGPGVDLNTRLSIFSAWRGAKGASDGAGLWMLLTNCSSGSEVGVAWLGQLCKVSASSSGNQSTSGTGVTAVTRSEWQVVAHEIGHSFGAIHDCAAGCTLVNSNPVCCPLTTSSCDANANYIMSPVSTKNVTNFSPCSIGNICTTLSSSLNTTCLATPGATGNPALISLKSCGNGILEAGEDCDPGSNADDPCCDASTCKFTSGSVCDPLNSPCCSSTCQFAASGTVCRASVDPTCDVAEVCSGTVATCPADKYTSDGTSCGSGGLACASGVCTSRSLQCQVSGASLNLTSACPARSSDSCSISCQDPSSNADCIVLEQSFRDGTPCGYAGTCENSVCQAGSALDVAKSWYRQNLQISIPVTIVAAIIVLLILIAIYRCCVRRNAGAKSKKIAPSARFANATPVAATGGRRRQHRSSKTTPESSNINSASSLVPGGVSTPTRPPQGYQAGASRRQNDTQRFGSNEIPTPPRRSQQQTPTGWQPQETYGGGYYQGPPQGYNEGYSHGRGPSGGNQWVDHTAYNGR